MLVNVELLPPCSAHMKDQGKIQDLRLQMGIFLVGEAYGGYSPLWKALSSDCEYKGSCRIHSDCKPDIHKQIKEEIH